MLSRRIIPCLDVRDGKVVKGVRFRDHVVMGEIVDLALRYRDEGADELVFYDITASPEGRSVDRGWVEKVARVIDIPFCVAGGIRSVDDARAVLHAGADKISVNSPALERPDLIDELAAAFGVQCVVVGIDSLRDDRRRMARAPVHRRSRQDAGAARKTLDWMIEAQQRGAGEIVLNCMGSDGVRSGYDLEQLLARAVCHVPLIASGGAGAPEHFRDAFVEADVDGALAASVFHSGASRYPNSRHICTGRVRGARSEHQGKPAMNDSIPIHRLDWAKGDGLLPAIVQHWLSGEVLMLGYMNAEALAHTQRSGQVTFYSRSKQRLWTKGESSGHVLVLKSIRADCDADTLLVQAEPHGPTCHGHFQLFRRRVVQPPLGFLAELDALVAQRHAERPKAATPRSCSKAVFAAWRRKSAKRVSRRHLPRSRKDDDELLGEAADLIFHLTVVLRARLAPQARADPRCRCRYRSAVRTA
jgi:cyclase